MLIFMLCELFIQNLAVIEKTSIQFDKGLNVFTGETGAGKSIVIDAINAVLGQRTSKEFVRHGQNKASITARFNNLSDNVINKLFEFGYEPEDGELIITREIFADSRSTARIMGRPVTVSILKEIGTELINIHGQHDNQILLSPQKHIDILDKYGDFYSLLDEYTACYKNVVQIKREMKKASEKQSDKVEKIDLLTYQIDEIQNAELKIGEDIELEAKRSEVRNSAKIIELLSQSHNALYGDNGEGGVVDLTKFATSSIEKATEFYEPADEIYTRLEGISAELDEITQDIYDKLDGFDFNQDYLDIIESRIDEINKLKRKYGETIEEILEYCKTAKQELSTLEISEQHLLELDENGKKEYSKLLLLAQKITDKRKSAAEQFIKSVTQELIFLDMPNVCLDVSLQHVKPNSKGQDNVEFLISTNKGEPPKPIAKIASGGELSRIMLAIKNTLADKDEIQTLIFDEIDTGVSGRAAQKIGLKLKQAAKNRQIITVTHLAQIASLADHHFLIKKDSDDENTYTNVTKLDYNGRIYEVARIMSTDEITDLMLENAKAMINAK